MNQATRSTDREAMLLNEPIKRLIPKMAIPTIVAFLINSIYSLADTFFVSSLGVNATAAVSVNASLDQIIMMFGALLAIGANSYIARLLGEKNKEKASNVLSTAFFTAFGFGVAVAVGGIALMNPLVRVLGATETCEQYAIDYATYVLLVAPLMTTSFVMNQCLRAEGSAVFSMIGMGFGGVLNCALDPIFINVLGLGVAGASMATAISKLVSFSILLTPYLAKHSLLRIHPRLVRYSRDIVTQILTVGSSSMFRSGLAVIASIILNNLAGNMSDSVLAGIGVSTKIMMFPFSIILGFGSGFQPVAGFNWGAKRYDRVMESYRFASKLAILGSLAMTAVLVIFANQIIFWFSGDDPQMMRTGALCIRLQSLALPIHAWVAVVNMLCSGLGFAGNALLLATSRQGSCFLPIIFPLVHFFGETGIVAAQAAADVLSLFLAVPIMRHIKRILNERLINQQSREMARPPKVN